VQGRLKPIPGMIEGRFAPSERAPGGNDPIESLPGQPSPSGHACSDERAFGKRGRGVRAQGPPLLPRVQEEGPVLSRSRFHIDIRNSHFGDRRRVQAQSCLPASRNIRNRTEPQLPG
jgi:hypothetical protein